MGRNPDPISFFRTSLARHMPSFAMLRYATYASAPHRYSTLFFCQQLRSTQPASRKKSLNPSVSRPQMQTQVYSQSSTHHPSIHEESILSRRTMSNLQSLSHERTHAPDSLCRDTQTSKTIITTTTTTTAEPSMPTQQPNSAAADERKTRSRTPLSTRNEIGKERGRRDEKQWSGISLFFADDDDRKDNEDDQSDDDDDDENGGEERGI
ncbi:hypothetical protein BKA81DRAFT_54751 [Phyllosticta paracitricarpa]|uniref:Uncharacterized protein n=1 Tax=Phyllosticta paracitricarpa TaxID=2016321 RepID=A0ABR1N390_9PEZI